MKTRSEYNAKNTGLEQLDFVSIISDFYKLKLNYILYNFQNLSIYREINSQNEYFLF